MGGAVGEGLGGGIEGLVYAASAADDKELLAADGKGLEIMGMAGEEEHALFCLQEGGHKMLLYGQRGANYGAVAVGRVVAAYDDELYSGVGIEAGEGLAVPGVLLPDLGGRDFAEVGVEEQDGHGVDDLGVAGWAVIGEAGLELLLAGGGVLLRAGFAPRTLYGAAALAGLLGGMR